MSGPNKYVRHLGRISGGASARIALPLCYLAGCPFRIVSTSLETVHGPVLDAGRRKSAKGALRAPILRLLLEIVPMLIISYSSFYRFGV